MAPTKTSESNIVPEFLHHTCFTVDEHDIETTKDIPRLYVIATHATIKAAKEFAHHALRSMGYDKADFAVYQEQTPGAEGWAHGDGVIVYAKAPAGQEFFVSIDTTLNTENLCALEDGSMILPHGADHLQYILQTKIDYRADRTVTTQVQGAYVKRNDAIEAARWCLLVDGPDDAEALYDQFDAREDLSVPEDWPFGEDVFVHAVAYTGENFLVSLRTPPAAYLKLSKHGREKRHSVKQKAK